MKWLGQHWIELATLIVASFTLYVLYQAYVAAQPAIAAADQATTTPLGKLLAQL